ncbi:MAG TPA: hypothetical protein VK681_00455, partial [Reyranella sp.]|nr:hypothetical protein [Reyranella sp.]
VIVVMTLAVDFVLLATVFSGMKRSWADAATAYTEAYILTDYDHDLAPNAKSQRAWGNIVYSWQTDRYGFRIGDCAPGEAEKDRLAIFVIGDSFTEAIGSSYEKSFAGLMACDAAKQGKAVWNLGGASYSPAIYHRKIRVAAQRLGLKPTDIYVFLDPSDIDDDANVYDANVYKVAADGAVSSNPFSLVPHRSVSPRQFRDLPAGLRSLPVLAVQHRGGPGTGAWPLDIRSGSHGEVGPAWTGNCRQQSRQDRRHLPGMGLPHDPRRLSVA